MVMNVKFEVEKFDGANFGMWRCEIMDVLFQQNLQMALEKDKSEDMTELE